MKEQKILVIDFGGQYNQLVARRVRECNVYCEIYSYKTPLEKIKAMNQVLCGRGGGRGGFAQGNVSCSEKMIRDYFGEAGAL